MGRLIDADKAIEDMEYYHDDCAKTSVYTRLGFKTAIEVIKDAPTVEAILKADYEARLKADMAAMLTKIQSEIEELEIPHCDNAKHADGCVSKWKVEGLIQQKINDLRGE